MKTFLLLLAPLLLISCASFKLVENPAPPKLDAIANAKSVTFVISNLQYQGDGLQLYQGIPGTKYFYAKPLQNLSYQVELYQAPPSAVNKALSDAQLRSLLQDALLYAVTADYDFSHTVNGPNFTQLKVSKKDQSGTVVAGKVPYEVKFAALPDRADVTQFATTTGTDLTVFFSVSVYLATGRVSDSPAEKSGLPEQVSPGEHIAYLDVASNIRVYDSKGNKLLGSIPSPDKYDYFGPMGDHVVHLLGVNSAEGIDAWEHSAEFTNLIREKAIASTYSYLRFLRPYVAGTYVEVKEQK